jgi:RNA polymerase sigma-B factor
VTAARLVLEHLSVADAVAARHRYPGHDPEDIRQVARMGLVMAANRYEESHGNGFAAFAVPTIAGVIKHHVRDTSWAVRPPRQVQELRLEVNAARRRLSQELGHEPTAQELARETGASAERVAEAQTANAALAAVPIQPTDPDDGQPVHAWSVLSAVEEGYEQVETREELRGLLAVLSDEERRLLVLRFVDEMSQSEIARVIGVSQMQVSRLLRRILDRVRRRAAEEALTGAIA